MRITAVVVMVAALRGFGAWRVGPPPNPLDPAVGPPTLVPDLERADVVELSWLPGLGAARARAVVEARPFLPRPLTPERLALVPGVGEATAAEVAAFYAAAGGRAARRGVAGAAGGDDGFAPAAGGGERDPPR